MKTILITGGAGYIGSHAVKLFLQQGYEVVIFDNLFRGHEQAVEILKKYGDCKFVKGDLKNREDIEKVFSEHNIAGVIHFAALCLVDESMKQPELYFENNVLGTLNLLRAMQGKVDKLIFSSTCAVYGETVYLPVDEKHPTNPANPYGESKLMVEKMIKWYGELHGLHYVILRYFNVCGADSNGEIGDSKKPSTLLMQNAVRGAMGIEEFQYTCPTVKTPDGTPIRDYIDVEDLVNAHMAAFKYLDNNGENRILNLGNGKGYSVKEIVSEVEKVFNKTLEKKQTTPRQGEYAAIFADNTLAKQILNWQPKKTLQESIVSLQKWYQRFPKGFDR